ncbi:hypothetical protein BN961_00643 [Afipia felis]|uniref:Uncharacterized protein n=1 Tax=Afipia felis TaxID=1035 RepID=A0A090MIB0_AFIFE|nr:hypothetical protein BN961_00643 [Afipia felis]
MTIDVIFRDIEQNADAGIERWCQIDLVGRHLDDVHAPRGRRLQRQDGGTDIAAHLHIEACLTHQMRGQCGGGGLAIGAGDGDERRARRMPPPLAAEQLDIADDFDASLVRHLDAPVRRRMGQRHARRKNKRREILPRHGAQVGGDETRLRGLRQPLGAVIAGDDFRAARFQCMATGQTRATETEYGDGLSFETGDGNHRLTAISVSTNRRAPASPR